MDFIFEEESDDVGSDIEAYCPKCKGDTSHTIITKYEDEIRRVQCSPCGDVHSYRKPRGEVEDELPEPVAAKKRAAAKKPTWAEARARLSEKAVAHARHYSIRETYGEGNLVSHPKFGLGFVTEISENKVELTFQDERRVLIHNRPDLAAQMPAIAAIPEPVSRGRARPASKKPATKAKAHSESESKTAQVAKNAVKVAIAPPVRAVANPKAPVVAAAKSKKTSQPVATVRPTLAAKPKKKVAKAERARTAVAKKSVGRGKPAGKKPTLHQVVHASARASRPARLARPKAHGGTTKVKEGR